MSWRTVVDPVERENSRTRLRIHHFSCMFLCIIFGCAATACAWTFIKYLQEIFVQFWVQHGNLWLDIFVQHQGEDGEHGVHSGVAETDKLMWPQRGERPPDKMANGQDASHISLLDSAVKCISQYFHIFPFSHFNSALTQRKCQRNKAAKCSLDKSWPFTVCISPNSQESLVEWDWSKVENRGEDRLETDKDGHHVFFQGGLQIMKDTKGITFQKNNPFSHQRNTRNWKPWHESGMVTHKLKGNHTLTNQLAKSHT